MSSDKPDLARAGTMQVTAKEGKFYLDKNLTEWKKPFLADHLEGEEEPVTSSAKGKGKAKLSKHTTMKGTAKEADALLGDSRPDPDAGTRAQQKKIEELSSPPPSKRAKKAASASALKTAASIHKTLEEAKALYGDVDMSEGRSLRKRPDKPKPALKKAGTMQNTAKEGKAFLKRQKKGAAKKKQEAIVEDGEENGDAETGSD